MSNELRIKNIKWNQLPSQESMGGLYQDYRWLKIIEKAFRHQTFIILAEDKNGSLAFLPLAKLQNPIFGNSLISLPFLNGGGVFRARSQLNDLDLAMAQEQIYSSLKKELTKEYNYLELRTNSNELLNHPEFTSREHKVTFVLDIGPHSESTFQGFSKKLKAQIKRPEKSGAISRTILGKDITLKDQEVFYQILSKHWRDLGSPIYPKLFFDLVFEEFKDQTLLSFIETPKGICSAGLTIIHGDQAEICWAGSLKSYNKSSPNMLLYWSTIKRLAELGVKTFDFGRCTKGSGTYHFKKQWGGEEKQLYWYYLKSSSKVPNISTENPKFKLAIIVWKILPVWLTTLIGSRISRYFP